MKTFLTLVAFTFCFIFACHREEIKPAIAGTYTGKSNYYSNRLTEIFVSPTQSKMTLVKDSSFQQPTVLVVDAFSKDSFKLVGDFAKNLPLGWATYGFSEGTGSDNMVFKRTFGVSGYFLQTITLEFIPPSGTFKIDYRYTSTVPQAEVLSHFEGKK
jgi:hypothetical protein